MCPQDIFPSYVDIYDAGIYWISSGPGSSRGRGRSGRSLISVRCPGKTAQPGLDGALRRSVRLVASRPVCFSPSHPASPITEDFGSPRGGGGFTCCHGNGIKARRLRAQRGAPRRLLHVLLCEIKTGRPRCSPDDTASGATAGSPPPPPPSPEDSQLLLTPSGQTPKNVPTGVKVYGNNRLRRIPRHMREPASAMFHLRHQ